MFTQIFYKIAQTGHEVTLWLLVILSFFSIAFILERFFTLRKVKNHSVKTNRVIQEALQSNNLKDIEDLAKDRNSFEGRALAYGLRHIKEYGHPGLEEIFSSYGLSERPRFDKYLNFLATIGSNAPFIGLLGTVFGIMDAFRELAGSQGDNSAVMLGISKALVATGVGLMVAIPAVIAYNYFQRQVKSIYQCLESVRDVCIALAKTNRVK